MTDAYSSMFGLADFEFPETEEQQKLRREKALAEAIQIEEAQTGERSTLRDQAMFATGGVRHTASGFLGGIAGAPWDIGALITEGSAALPSSPSFGGALLKAPAAALGAAGIEPQAAANWMRQQGKGARSFFDEITGTELPPQTSVEKGGRLLGESAQPAGKLTIPLTAAVAGAKYFSQPNQPAMDEPSLMTGRPLPPPERTFSWLDSVSPISTALAAPQPSVSHTPKEITVEAQGGPVSFNWKDYATMGGLVAATAGMIFAPKLIGTFTRGAVPRLRPVVDAAPGTSTISTVGDYMRTQDDVNAGLVRIAERAGSPVPVVDALKDRLRFQTRGEANALGESAIIGGRAETPTFTFQTAVPMADLIAANVPNASRYMNLRNIFDEIGMIDARIAAGRIKNPPPGPTTVQGMAMPDVLQEMHALEQATPQLRQLAQGYTQNLRDLRKFEEVGEYGTLSKKERAWENSNRPNDTAFTGMRALDEAPVDDILQNSAVTIASRIKFRIENESKGMYIDELRKVRPELAVGPVSKEWLDKHPRAETRVVTFYRRGVLERYTVDPYIADVMKLDPYYMTGAAQQVLYGSKRLLEMGATGALAPWFISTSFIRSVWINRHTAASAFPGAKSVGFTRSLYAVPQQLVPQLAKAVSSSLDRGSAGWLLRTLNVSAGNIQALSTRLAHTYHNSLFHQLQSVGSTHGNVLTQQAIARNQFNRAIQTTTGPLKSLLSMYMRMVEAGHNAPSFAFASKNYGKVSLPKLAGASRHLTGSPRVGGQYYSGGGLFTGGTKPIRFEDTRTDWRGRVSRTVHRTIAQPYGYATELGRSTVPWFNVTTQGVKRIGEAYIKNPAGFIGRTWLYTMLPAAAGYMYTAGLGKDPNGLSYIDYMFNRRNDYKKTMNFYIPIPGRPAEEGIEFPRFHELAPAARMMETALHHMTHSSLFSQTEDFMRVAQSFFNIAISPPLPPIFGVSAATMGYTAPQGVFGGEMYKRRSEPFDQSGGLPINIELLIRALGGGIGDVVGAGAAAFTQTPEGIDKAFKNALAEMGTRAVSKTPILRDVLGIHAPSIGNTDVVSKMFEKNRAIKQLSGYYNKWTVKDGALYGGDPGKKRDVITESGERVAQEKLGPRPPRGNPGMGQKDPTNPLYIQFAKEVHEKFMRDATLSAGGQKHWQNLENQKAKFANDPIKLSEIKAKQEKIEQEENVGGIGFKSLFERYNIATRAIQRINKVNAGNFVTWQDYLLNEGEVTQYLHENKVNIQDPVSVKNFYERQRQDAARVILHTIKAVENDFSKRIGQPIKIEDLKPYGPGTIELPEVEVTDTGLY